MAVGVVGRIVVQHSAEIALSREVLEAEEALPLKFEK